MQSCNQLSVIKNNFKSQSFSDSFLWKTCCSFLGAGELSAGRLPIFDAVVT